MRLAWVLGLLALVGAVVRGECTVRDSGPQSLKPSESQQQVDVSVLERAETAVKVRSLMNAKFVDTETLLPNPVVPARQRIWIGRFDYVMTLHIAFIRRKLLHHGSYFHIRLYDGCFTSPPIFSATKYLDPDVLLPEKDQIGWVEFPVNQAVEPARYYWLKMWLSKDESGTIEYKVPDHGILVNCDQFVLGQLFTEMSPKKLVDFPAKKKDVMFVMRGSLSASSLQKRRYLPTTNIVCPSICLPVGTLEKPGVEKRGGSGSRMNRFNILVVEDKTPPDWDPEGKDLGKQDGRDQPGSFDAHDENVVKQDVLQMLEGEEGIANYEPFKSQWDSINIYMARMRAEDDFVTTIYESAQDRYSKGMWGCANIDLSIELVTPYVPTGKIMPFGAGVGSFAPSVAYKTPGSLFEMAYAASHEIGHSLGLRHGASVPTLPPKQKELVLNWVAPGCLEPMGWCTESFSIEEVKSQTLELYNANPAHKYGDPAPCWSEAAQVNEDACQGVGNCIWRDGLGADAFYENYKCVPKMIVVINLCKEAATPEIKQGGCYVGPGELHDKSVAMNVASPIGDCMYTRNHVPGPPQPTIGYNAANAEQIHKLFKCVFNTRCRIEDWTDCQQFYSFWGDPKVHPENIKFIEKGLGCHEKTFKRR